jgi:hypothetical protein
MNLPFVHRQSLTPILNLWMSHVNYCPRLEISMADRGCGSADVATSAFSAQKATKQLRTLGRPTVRGESMEVAYSTQHLGRFAQAQTLHLHPPQLFPAQSHSPQSPFLLATRNAKWDASTPPSYYMKRSLIEFHQAENTSAA